MYKIFIFVFVFFLLEELTEILSQSEDPEELKYYWTQWYNLAGTPTRQDFETYLRLNKESAILNNFTSGAELWLSEYEDPTIEHQLENIFEEIRPLYQQLHAYVRHSLRGKYGDLVSEGGLIPMHLLGNMWAQSWESVFKYTKPFPNKRSTDVTEEMTKQNYTPLKMFQLGEKFFQSLNMSALPKYVDSLICVCHIITFKSQLLLKPLGHFGSVA